MLIGAVALAFAAFGAGALERRMPGRVPGFSRWVLVAALAMLLAALAFPDAARADTRGGAIRVPEASRQYMRAVERAEAEFWGLNGHPARLAAQIHEESRWQPSARSPYAIGLSQFVPSTATWLPEVCPEVGPFDPWDPWQSIRAASCYNRWHHRRLRGASECDRWAFTLSAYNGGLGWVQRDQRLAAAAGADAARWWDNVELYTARSAAARAENRSYVERILRRVEPTYRAAGWDGEATCP